MAIFKAYDIRGVVPDQLNEETAYKVARALAVFLKASKVVVGRDCRQSSPSLARAVIEGFLDQGVDVIDTGLVSSPMFSYCVGSLDVDGGIMVTASHNPPEYNGFKLASRGAVYLSGESGIQEVEALVQKGVFPKPKRGGAIARQNLLPAYASRVVSFARKVKPMRIVVDAGNGMAGVVCPPIFAKLPLTVTPLWFDLDGRFPNRGLNPMMKENLVALSLRVKKEQAALGIAFDPDGDRVAFVDETGEFIPNDLITALIAKEVAFRESKPLVLYDVRSSRAVAESLQADGIASLKTRVGHAFIKAMMRKHNAAFAGELSGHFYFRDFYCCDSGVIAAMFVLSLVSRTGKRLSELANPLRRYVSTGEVNFMVKNTADVLAAVKEHFQDASIEELDGVTASYDDWWVNVRESHTEPVVRMIIEATTAALLESKRAEVENLIAPFLLQSRGRK